MLPLLALPLAALGAILNRFRGGGIILLPGETIMPDHKHTQIRRIVYCVFISLIAWNPFAGMILFASLLTGWGFPISATIGKNSSPWEPEFWPLDQFTTLLVGRQNSQKYGTVWLYLYGTLSGLLVAFSNVAFWLWFHGFPLDSLQTWIIAPVEFYWPLLWGLMPLCYKATNDMEWGEIFYGALQSFTLVLFLITNH